MDEELLDQVFNQDEISFKQWINENIDFETKSDQILPDEYIKIQQKLVELQNQIELKNEKLILNIKNITETINNNVNKMGNELNLLKFKSDQVNSSLNQLNLSIPNFDAEN